jgi:hypothetical protein
LEKKIQSESRRNLRKDERYIGREVSGKVRRRRKEIIACTSSIILIFNIHTA